MKSDIYFIPLGGGQQVGASCYFLKIGSHNILLDSGVCYNNGLTISPNLLFLKRTKFIESLSQIDCVFISHAHMDHIGNLPYLMRTIPNAPVFMTDTTKKLSYYQLYEKSLRDNYIKSGNELEGISVQQLFDKIVTVSFLQTMSFGDLKVTFFPAGHIPGAMMILFEYRGKNILYTGDYSINKTPLTEGCLIPDKRIDIAIICALHAKNSFYHHKSNSLYKCLNYIERKINYGLSVQCEIKQLSKGIEFLELLNSQIENYLFPKIPIYIDDKILKIIETVEKSIKPLIRDNIHSAKLMDLSENPCIFLTTKSKRMYNFEFMTVDFTLHDDFDDIITFLKRLNAREVVVVHTAIADYEGESVESKLIQDPDCNMQFIFAENEENYKL